MPPHIVLNPHLQSSYFIFRYTTIFVGMLFPTSVRIVQRPIIINNTFADIPQFFNSTILYMFTSNKEWLVAGL
jgi:hypothetical protein